MKRISITLLISLILAVYQVGYSQTTIVGNGQIIKTQRTISSFSKLSVRVGMRVRIVPGDAGILDLEGESNILEHVVTDVKNGELTVMLTQNKSYNQTKGVTVTLHVAKLDQVMVSTGSSVESDRPIQANKLVATVETGSRITAPISTKMLKLTVREGSQANLEGTATDADISLSGAGKLNADKLTIAHANLRVDGASRADIHVTESLSASADGVSTVNYTGNPTVKSTEATGLSKIRKQGK
ncbi:head GIN domain-containing protein [Spirosoma aerophilum]